MDAVPDNVFALETTTYRHRSPTWKYYEAPNKKDRTAVCKLCNETLSFKSSISNLKKHLKRRHNMFTKNGSGDEDTNETYLEEETEDKRASEKFPRTSVVWKHYEVPDREERTAECKYCKETLSYKSGISNLKKHLLRKHDSVFKNDSDDEAVMSETYLEDDEESVNGDEPKDKRRSRRSGVWEYFDVTDEEQRTANCQLCSEEFSYRSTSTNLVRHLQRKHGVVFMHSESDNDKEGDSEKRPRKPTNNRTSIAWDYFTIKNPDKKLATCKVCTKDCSYFTSTSNLLKHVRRAHGIGYMADDEPDDEEETQVKISRSDHARRSTVWAYFKHLDRASCLAVCLICKKKLSYLTTITNLKRHLIRKHPQLELDGIVDAKQMIVGSDGQLYEIDDNAKQEILDDVDDDDNDVNGNDNIDEQNAEPMEIYLDEVEGNVIEKLKSQKPHKKVKRVVIEESDDTDDGEITYKKRYVKTSTDSLDKFGSYLVSLLRQLPKADSNRLQADFVKQIMNCQSEEGIVVSDSYVTTIAECKDDLVADSSASNDDVLVQTTIVDSDCQ